MTGLVLKATLLVVAGVMIAGAAMAGVPSPLNSTLPDRIIVMDGDRGSPAGGWRVSHFLCLTPGLTLTIRDWNNNPVPYATVVFDFTACSPDAIVEECSLQPDPAVGLAGVTEGPGETIAYTANGAGELCATVIGSGTNITPFPGGRPLCGKIYAASVLVGFPKVSVAKLDLSGDDDVDAFDGALWLDDAGQWFAGTYNSRSDYDGDGDVDAYDASLFLVAALMPMLATELSACPGLLP